MPAKKTEPKTFALWYAAQGWYVFPVKPRTKIPYTENGYKDASIDPDVIEAWWDDWPDANIGLACGMSGLIAIDGDPFHYTQDSFDLVHALWENPETPIQSTPADGVHFLFRLPSDVELNNGRGTLPPGIDVRVNGYILLAQSFVTYHGKNAEEKGVPDGHSGYYRWLVKPNEFEPKPLPDFILEKLKAKQEPPRQSAPSNNGNGYHPPDSDDDRYARVALERELSALQSAQVGQRNEQLNRSAFSLAQLCAGGALNESMVRGELERIGKSIGLDEREVLRTIESGFSKGKQQPRSVPVQPKLKWRKRTETEEADEPSEEAEIGIPAPNVFDYHPEDGGLLDAWTDAVSNEWVFVTGYDSWYGWTGTHWQLDDMLEVHYQIEEMIAAMNEQARAATKKAKADGDENKEKAFRAYVNATKRSKSRVSSVEGMARAKRTRAASHLDTGNVLNLLNGTLNLDDLILRDHHRADMLTYTLPYEYDYYADCPRFKQFISEVLVKEDGKTPDPDLALLCQELVGYSLTQETSQEVMVWLAGEGGNGKTVMITVLSKLLGPLAVSMNFQTIGMAGNYDLADLPGKRIVFSTESERGGNMAEGYIKRIVSGETIRARPIYGTPFSFQSAAKVWWAMNDMPTVKDTSNALHRRLKLIRFHRVFKDSEKDIHLIDKLSAELPGILNWALSGLIRLREQGHFTNARAVDAAKDEFKLESNPVALWLKERTEPGGSTVAMSAFENFTRWCTRSNQKDMTSNSFGRELTRLGLQSVQKRTGKTYPFSLLPE